MTRLRSRLALVLGTIVVAGMSLTAASTFLKVDIPTLKKMSESVVQANVHAVAYIAGKNRAEADDVATRADEAARGLTDLESATHELEDVAAMLRELTRGFASIA